jgi:hypothetical protein
MNKRDAKQKSCSGEITIGQLRAMIAKARGRGGMSRLNPAIPFERAADIYENALAGRLDNEKPVGMRPDPYSRVGALKPTRDALIISNILRDCG